MAKTHRIHSFPPIADERARVLILGSMPGTASLKAAEYYAHPRNAFWPILGKLVGAGRELPYEQRCKQVRAAGIAIWDVLAECSREGSLDMSIETETEVANDFAGLFKECTKIERVLFNGLKAEVAWHSHVATGLGSDCLARLELIRLPSTSPANAGKSFEEKHAAWRVALQLCHSRC